jgi:CBS domain-containing protein
MFDPDKIKARNIMQSEVVQLNSDASIKSAIETFEDYSISGAPVVNETGELVGVLSDTDIVKIEHLENDDIHVKRAEYYFNDPFDELDEPFFSQEDYSPEALGQETVGDWMTPHVISVGPEAPLSEICAIMTRERIHRVFVVKEKKLLGVITTFDIVKKLGNAVKVKS